MKYKVNENCIGCGLCVSICPEVFEMSNDEFAVAKSDEIPKEAEDSANDAMESCPVSAIEKD